MKKAFFCFFLLLSLSACRQKELADFIIHNGPIYILDSSMTIVEAMAVKDGKIAGIGSFDEVTDQFQTQERINLEGKPVFPGFIDAHCHFLYYGLHLQHADLTGTKNFNEVMKVLEEYASTVPEKKWIIGRGWDQNDWDQKEFPDNQKLDSLFPEKPVFIERIDGHAAIANSYALKIAGISAATKVNGGKIELNSKGKPTGILVDNAMDLVKKMIPVPSREEKIKALKEAQARSFSVGLTTVDDAGLDKEDIELIDSLHRTGDLKIKVYAMISDKESNLNHYLEKGPYQTADLTVRSVKVYVDGALGSRGACLTEPYSDDPGTKGFLLNSPSYYKEKAKLLAGKGFQLNAHCIGDSANRLMLKIYSEVLDKNTDHRWRIEHAQVVHDKDLNYFTEMKVIPSVQPTHATSDMYWAGERLGNDREKRGYRYAELLKAAGIVAIGSDFPVEDINPLYGFYAAVSRKDRTGNPASGYLPENKITREQALRGITIWAAYSNFEERSKGSLEKGKTADFVVLDTDIMKAPEEKLHQAKVVYTYSSGRKVFQRSY